MKYNHHETSQNPIPFLLFLFSTYLYYCIIKYLYSPYLCCRTYFLFFKNMSQPFQKSGSRLEKKNSFEKKSSMVQITQSGEWQRPNISRITSQEKEMMPEKIYKLMSSYIPKDINTIETLYILFKIEL